VNTKLQRILLHEFVVMKYNCLVELTQTDAISVVQIVVESVVEQYQFCVSALVSADKNCQHNDRNDAQ